MVGREVTVLHVEAAASAAGANARQQVFPGRVTSPVGRADFNSVGGRASRVPGFDSQLFRHFPGPSLSFQGLHPGWNARLTT